MISWDTCKEDFLFDGSWRDIYIASASLDDWKEIFPFLRMQPGIEFVREEDPEHVPEVIDASFFGEARPTLRVRSGGVVFAFHFFSPDEIECDIDPREVTGQGTLDAVLAFMRQLGDLTCKRAVLTSESVPNDPIISYDPVRGNFQHHRRA